MRARTLLHAGGAVVAALALVALAASTRFRRAPPHRAEYVGVGALRLRYVRAGRGPTVVLVHGFGESLLAWRSVFDRLAEDHDVIALDLPGFGLSSKPATGYATDSLAQDLLGALDALRVRRAVLVGHSMGGAVVAAAALADTARVQAVVLLDAALVGAPAPVTDARRGFTSGAGAGAAIAEYEALRTRFAAPHDPGWLAEPDSARRYTPAGDDSYRTAVQAVLREFDFDYLTDERASRWRTHTLVLWGQYDEVFTVARGRRLADRLAGSRFEIVPRTWHRPHEERPEETGAALERFLQGLQVGQKGAGTP